MEERARQLGGDLEWSTPGGGGTALVWKVPVREE
jgi:signal transduction histidine kinase